MKKECQNCYSPINKFPNGLARSIMREILREGSMSYGEVDSICKLLPIDASIARIVGNTHLGILPEGKELSDAILRNKKAFHFGIKLELVFCSFLNKPSIERRVFK